MKTTSLFCTCLLAATMASAGNDSAKHSKKHSTTRSSASTESSSIDSMNESNYDRTFGVRTRNFTNSPSSDSLDNMNESNYDRTFGVRTRNFTNSQVPGSIDQMSDRDEDRTFGVRDTASDENLADESITYDTQDGTTVGRNVNESSSVSEERVYGGAAVGAGSEPVESSTKTKTTTTTTKTSDTSDVSDNTSSASGVAESNSGTAAATGAAAGAASGKVAEDQSQAAKDLEITRQIRQEIMNNKNMTTRAENITIVTENGRVSLRGAVANNQEKAAVEKIARGVSGVSSVNSQVTVKK